MRVQDFSKLLQAIEFSAYKHRSQRRKDKNTPYINHPISVARMIWEIGKIRDVDIIIAAILHDTVEDTDTTFEELRETFGERVEKLVREVSDDKSLPKETRKRLQVEHAERISDAAKIIKIADKISNMRDLYKNPPKGWPLQRKRDYLLWARDVVDKMRGVNPALEKEFDRVLEEGLEIYR